MHADCLDAMPGLTGVDIILADMPYGATRNKWDSPIPLVPLWKAIEKISPKVVVLTAKQPFSSSLVMSNLKWFRYEWIWEKSKASGFLNAKKLPLSAHENILVFSKDSPPYYPVMTQGIPYNKGLRKAQETEDSYGRYSRTEVKSNGSRYPRSVQYFKTAEGEGSYHKTQKPIALMEYLILTYTRPGETVLDFCMGSGTIGVACKNTDRKFIGIEKDEKYFNIAMERLSA